MKLYVVGVGPGDPELITLKAKRLIEETSLIFYPTGGKENLALSIVEKIIPLKEKNLVELQFPMKKGPELETHYEKLAERISQELKKFSSGVFLVLGDPAFYATFYYLKDRLFDRRVEIEVIPAVSSFSSASAKGLIPLTLGEEVLLLLPAERLFHFPKDLFTFVDCLVVMKAKKNLSLLEELSQKDGFSPFFFRRLHLKEEFISQNWKEIKNIEPDYFSLAILKKLKK